MNFSKSFFIFFCNRLATCLPAGMSVFLGGSLLLVASLAPTANSYAQRNNSQYLPQYNLWVPSCNSHSNNKVVPKTQPSSVDSVFYWQYVMTPTFGIYDIYFVDSLYGWYTDGSGFISRSTDSGYDWDTTALFPGGGADVTGVYFINDNTGWAVGQVSLIRKTTNGGVNWLTQDWPPRSGAGEFYYSVHFFNTNTGIVTGEYDSPYNQGYIIRTTNGGTNWAQVYISTDSNYSETSLLRQFWINNDTGWFAGDNILLKSTDRGNTFINFYSHVPPTQNGYNGFFDLYFVNKDTGWICGGNLDSRNIYKTTNAGLNWTFQDNPVAHYYYPQIDGIIFISPDTGWASSYVGLIIVTTNGGTTWLVDDATNEWSVYFTKYQSTKVWLGAFPGYIFYNVVNTPIGIANHNWNTVESFKLYQNYPNPFNPATKIKFSISDGYQAGALFVKLTIFDVLGRQVAVLLNQELKPGTYELNWDGTNYPSSVYFCELRTSNSSNSEEDFIQIIKLVLLK